VGRQAADKLHGHDVARRVAATEGAQLVHHPVRGLAAALVEHGEHVVVGSQTEGAIPPFDQFLHVHIIVFPCMAAVVSSASRGGCRRHSGPAPVGD